MAITFQEYAKEKDEDDARFDVVHFFHSLYYVDLETTLKHCYEKELKAYWIILCVIQWEENAFMKYGRRAFTQSLVFNPGAYLSDEQVRDIAEKNG